MSLIIEKFTDEELMEKVFIFLSVGGYPEFYKVDKITKKQVYLIRLKHEITKYFDDGDCCSATFTATNDMYYYLDKPLKKIIKRDKIDDCDWGNSYTRSSYIWE